MSRSHKHGMTLSFGNKGVRLTFTKKASRFNNCIGDKLRKGKPGSRAQAKAAFKAAVSGCR